MFLCIVAFTQKDCYKMFTLVKVLPAVTLYKTRYLSKANKTYIERMGQNMYDKDLAFMTGFIVSSIVPYSIFIGSISSLYTERSMLKTIKHMDHMIFDKQDDFAKQTFHKRYFLAHNGANGMFLGSIFFTMLGITSCVVGLKGVGFW